MKEEHLVAKLACGNDRATAFLISPSLAVTAAHAVSTTSGENLKLEFRNISSEKIIVSAKPLDIDYSRQCNIDIVLLRLDKEILDQDFLPLVEGSIPEEIRWTSFGYPCLKPSGEKLRGNISRVVEDNQFHAEKWDIDLLCDNDLSSYKGLSGAPLIVNECIVGVIIAQSDNSVVALSLHRAKKIFERASVDLITKDIVDEDIPELKHINKDWFRRHLEDAIKFAEPRYSPFLNVDVPVRQTLEAFGHTEYFNQRIKSQRKLLSAALRNWARSVGNEADWNGEKDYPRSLVQIGKEIYCGLTEVINNMKGLQECPLNPKVIEQMTSKVPGLLEKAKECQERLIEDFEAKHGKGKHESKSFLQFMAEYMCVFPARHIDYAKEVVHALEELDKWLRSTELKAYFGKTLLISGVAGTGKTHLICDCASERLTHNLPSIVLFGEHFSSGEPWTQIMQRLHIPLTVSADVLLRKLNHIAEEIGLPLVIFIDAVNETKPRDFWRSNLKSIIQLVEHYDFLRLCISCRSSYIEEIITSDIKFTEIEHEGFKDVEFEASVAFFQYYNLPLPSTPLMQPEFSNPLFLKLYCESLKDSGEEFLHEEALGLTRIIDRFISEKNVKIAQRIEGIMTKEKSVQKALQAIVIAMYEEDGKYLNWTIAKEIVDKIHPNGVTFLFEQLLSEHLIREDRNGGTDVILIGFERLGDFIYSKHLLQDVTLENIQQQVKYGKIASVFKDEKTVSKNAGIVEALSVLIPEKYGLEITELPIKILPIVFKKAIQGLLWRSDKSVTASSERLLTRGFSSGSEICELSFRIILSLATRKNNCINACFLHRVLVSRAMAQRDSYFCPFIYKNYEDGKEVRKLLHWIYKVDVSKLDQDSAWLWSLTLQWFCSSNDRRIRDNATKSLVAIIEQHPNIAVKMMDALHEIDDEYVIERSLGAIYGALVRNKNTISISEVVDKIYKIYFENDTLPVNVLIRDYLRCIGELALSLNVLGDLPITKFRPPFKSKWPLEIPTDDFVKGYENSHRELPKLYRSCFHDDFEKYVAGPRIGRFEVPEKDILKWIFAHVVTDLGYSSAFGSYDGYMCYHYGTGRTRPLWAERVGKKYQYIALYRVLGHLNDNCKVRQIWKEAKIIPGLQGEDLRNIDPTVLTLQRKHVRFLKEMFSYDFAATSDKQDNEWVKIRDIPKPEGIIQGCLSLESDDKWFVLGGFIDWNSVNAEEDDGEEDRYPYRHMWLQIRSYLVKNADVKKLWRSIENKHYMGRWMPEGIDFHEGFLGEYPWGVTYQNRLSNQEYIDDIVKGSKLPIRIIPMMHSVEFSYQLDSSAMSEESKSCLVPCETFFCENSLLWDKQNGYLAAIGEIVFCSVKSEFGSFLVAKADYLQDWLAKKGLTMIWTALGEKNIIDHSPHTGSLEYSQTFLLSDGKIESSTPVWKDNE